MVGRLTGCPKSAPRAKAFRASALFRFAPLLEPTFQTRFETEPPDTVKLSLAYVVAIRHVWVEGEEVACKVRADEAGAPTNETLVYLWVKPNHVGESICLGQHLHNAQDHAVSQKLQCGA